MNILPLVLALCVGLDDPAPSAGPFAQGKFRVTIALGMGGSFDQQYVVGGGGLGYFVLDGLELGFGGDVWIGGEPTIGRISPEVRYILYFIPSITPYVGAFYRHWFVGGGFADWDTLGGKAGIVWVSGEGFFLGLGAVYERILSACQDRCDWVYPEIFFALTF